MKEIKYNQVVFSKDLFDTEEECFETIGKQLKILLQQEYICVVRQEDMQTFIIEYEHDNHIDPDDLGDWGNDRPMWVTSEEEDMILDSRQEDQPQLSEYEYEDEENDTDFKPTSIHEELGILGN